MPAAERRSSSVLQVGRSKNRSGDVGAPQGQWPTKFALRICAKAARGQERICGALVDGGERMVVNAAGGTACQDIAKSSASDKRQLLGSPGKSHALEVAVDRAPTLACGM